MANDNYIKHFTAADIERYHKGQLSNREMHDLEKAAMDDPFLADALEGYAVTGVQAGHDIIELKKRLAGKVEGAKVIPMNAAPRNSFRMLRAAALIVFIAGAGLLIYQFGFNKKENGIAQTKETAKIDSKTTDSSTGVVTNPSKDVSAPVSGTKTAGPKTGSTVNETVTVTTEIKTGETTVATGKVTADDVTVHKLTQTEPVVTAPAKVVDERIKAADEKNDKYKVPGKTEDKKELAKQETDNKNRQKENNQDFVNDGVKDQGNQPTNRSVAANRKADNNQFYNNSNIFRGRVTDADNNGVPFANVTNVQDNNAGTYTDARGYFNLTYPDSVLTVQVRSIGFENNNVQLRNAVPSNQVILQDDRTSLSERVLSNQKVNANARNNRDANMKLEEPEPADGWDKYDAYLVNNLEVPEDLKNKQTGSGEVQVSFEVDKNGEPVNIKVEKSLCNKCDKEAIRLVKEGPKWKRNAKKGRTTVTIPF